MLSRSCLRHAVFLFAVTSGMTQADPHQTLDLDTAIRSAMKAGDIEAQAQKVEEARGRLQQRLLRPNPTVTYDRQDIFDAGNAPGFAQDLVKFEQPLRHRRVHQTRKHAGEHDIDFASCEAGLERDRRIIEVRRAFARALEAQQLIEVHQRAIIRTRKAQEIVSLREKAGESSRYENARMTLATAQERDLTSASRVEFTRALADLGTSMATSLPTSMVLQGRLPDPLALGREDGDQTLEKPGHSPAGHIGSGGTLVEPVGTPWMRRPEIALEGARLAQARADEKVIRAEVRPQVNLGLGYMHFDQTALTPQNGYNAIVSVNLPLNDRRQGEIRATRARATAAQLSREATVARLHANADGAREHLMMANHRLAELLDTQRSGTTEMVTMAETSYGAGLQSMLELLDAYRVERDFQLARVRAQGALLLAIEDYAHALGVTPEELWPQLKQDETASHEHESEN